MQSLCDIVVTQLLTPLSDVLTKLVTEEASIAVMTEQ